MESFDEFTYAFLPNSPSVLFCGIVAIAIDIAIAIAIAGVIVIVIVVDNSEASNHGFP